MKKFSKIFVLLFAVVAILTAFSVVSLAADEAIAPNSYTYDIADSWNGKADGAFIGVAEERYGYMYAKIAADGNYYAIFEPKDGTSNNFVEPNLAGSMNADKTFVYNLRDYPYIMFDLDIMTPTGTHNNPSFNLRLQHTTARDGKSVYVNYPLVFTVSSFKNYLDTTSGKWSHVSVVMYTTFDTDAETGKITKTYVTYTYFINGVKATTSTATPTHYNGYLPEDCGHTSVRINGTSGNDETQKTAVDNLTISYFTGNYGGEGDAKLEAMVAQVYNDSYEMPFGTAIASIGNTAYDDINKAIDAAEDGQTIALLGNVDGILVVNKPIIIDKNIYDEDGNATGEYYDITVSSTALVPEEKDGIIAFYEIQNASVEVYWDDCPGLFEDGVCTCPDEFKDHLMSDITESVMLNTVPLYTGEIPKFEVVNGLAMEFVGWSYTQGGEVEELRPITPEDCDEGYISLFPVYATVQYDIEIKDPNGESSYFFAKDYYTAISAAKSGSTVILYNDVETSSGLTIDKVITIDLNGHSIRKWNISNVEYYLNTATNTTSVKTYGTKSSVFHIGASDAHLIIKSSQPGGSIYNGTLFEKNLYWDNDNRSVLVKETAHGGIMGGSIVGWGSATNATVTIYGENLSTYCSSLVDADNGAAKGSTVNIYGGTYYRTVSDYSALLTNRNGANFNVKDATFFGNDATLLYVWSSKTGEHQDMTFENCTFVEGDFYTEDSAKITFKGCKLQSIGFKKGTYADISKFILDSGCHVNGAEGNLGHSVIAEGYAVIASPHSETITRSALTAHKLNADKTDLDREATYNAGTKDVTYTFDYVVVDAANDIVNVKWVDAEGNLFAETKALKNSIATAPVDCSVPSGDGWRNVMISKWTDKDGNESDLAIGEESEYIFYAAKDQGDDAVYVANVTGAMMNVTYYAQLSINFYVPVNADMESAPTFSGSSATSKVLINGEQYWCYVFYGATSTAFNENVQTLTFTIDGQTYSQKFAPNALVYAEIVLADKNSTDAEKLAVANMVRFVKEFLIESGASSIPTNRIEALIGENGAYALPDYIADTEYPDLDADAALLNDYIESIHFRVSGNYAAYVFTKTQKGIDENISISVKNSAGEGIGLRDATGKTPWTLNLKAMHAYKTLTVTVTVPAVTDAETGDVITEQQTISATYSIGAYINATDSDLARALYAFGVAAENYRNSRTDY